MITGSIERERIASERLAVDTQHQEPGSLTATVGAGVFLVRLLQTIG